METARRRKVNTPHLPPTPPVVYRLIMCRLPINIGRLSVDCVLVTSVNSLPLKYLLVLKGYR